MDYYLNFDIVTEDKVRLALGKEYAYFLEQANQLADKILCYSEQRHTISIEVLHTDTMHSVKISVQSKGSKIWLRILSVDITRGQTCGYYDVFTRADCLESSFTVYKDWTVPNAEKLAQLIDKVILN